MNLSFQQACDLHDCLRYVEAIQGLGNRDCECIEYGDITLNFSLEDGSVIVDSLYVCDSKCLKGAKIVQDYFYE